jgi:hypothetical protein
VSALGSNVREAIFLSAGIFFFITAVSFGFYLFQTVTDSIDTTFMASAASDRAQQMIPEIPKEVYTVSGAVVLQSIRQIAVIGVPITVDGVTYDPNLDIHKVDVSNIDVTAEYVPTYNRGADGELTSILFTIAQ